MTGCLTIQSILVVLEAIGHFLIDSEWFPSFKWFNEHGADLAVAGFTAWLAWSTKNLSFQTKELATDTKNATQLNVTQEKEKLDRIYYAVKRSMAATLEHLLLRLQGIAGHPQGVRMREILRIHDELRNRLERIEVQSSLSNVDYKAFDELARSLRIAVPALVIAERRFFLAWRATGDMTERGKAVSKYYNDTGLAIAEVLAKLKYPLQLVSEPSDVTIMERLKTAQDRVKDYKHILFQEDPDMTLEDFEI